MNLLCNKKKGQSSMSNTPSKGDREEVRLTTEYCQEYGHLKSQSLNEDDDILLFSL